MFIKQLSLYDFRNYERLTVDFSKRINLIIGKNAQGKTSLIEAIYALSTTKSHRTNKDLQMVRLNEEFSRINVVVDAQEQFDLSLVISKKGKKAKYNGIDFRLLSEYVGKLKVVFFAPEDLLMIKGSPTVRRRFLNMAIGQIDSIYLHHLSQYNKILKQRNELLKNFIENESNQLMLEVLTDQLIPHLVYISKKRMWFLSTLERHASRIHQHVTDSKEFLSLKYISSLKLEEWNETEILCKYEANYVSDKRMRTTTLGIHRDDFFIEVDGMDASDFASQGQQRTAILSMKFAEIDLIYEVSGVYPILLLDDVLSELDASRQNKLLSATNEKVQTFITTTSMDEINDELIETADIFEVNEAEIKKKF